MNKIGRWCLKNRLNKKTKDTSLNRSVFESPLQQKIKNEEKKEKHQEPKVTAKVYSITKKNVSAALGGFFFALPLLGHLPVPCLANHGVSIQKKEHVLSTHHGFSTTQNTLPKSKHPSIVSLETSIETHNLRFQLRCRATSSQGCSPCFQRRAWF